MATSLSTLLHIIGQADIKSTSPHTGTIVDKIENTTGGTIWTNGTGSGKADRVYFRSRSALGAGATDSYNLLAAGSLVDVYNQAIDADELKALVLKVTSGAVKLEAPAANFIGIFADASDVILLGASAKCNTIAFDFGAAGLDVTTNASFDITETSGATTANYELWVVVSQ